MNKGFWRLGFLSTILYLVFGATWLYLLLVPLRESASIQVDHFQSGANGLWLLWCGVLALFAAFSLFTKEQTVRQRVSQSKRLLLAALPILLWMLMWASYHEQQAPDYQEHLFSHIITAFEGGEVITKKQVSKALGVPLSQEVIAEREAWSYTYMPSTGFGWRKRVLFFNQEGILVAFNNFDEP